MSEFPVLTREDLDPEQRAYWDEITRGPRGFYTGGPNSKRLPDLYNAWMQFPGLGRAVMGLADEVRAQPELSGKFRELIVLTSSILLGARVEYEFHIPFARDQGLSEDLIAAIGEGATPPFSDDAERIIYEANVQLLRSSKLTEKTRDEVVGIVGLRGLVQLIGVIIIYVATAYTTNVAGAKLAGDFSADPEKLKNFYAGRPAESE